LITSNELGFGTPVALPDASHNLDGDLRFNRLLGRLYHGSVSSSPTTEKVFRRTVRSWRSSLHILHDDGVNQSVVSFESIRKHGRVKMNRTISKNNEGRVRGVFGWLLKDWAWEVVLVLLVAPVVVDSMLSVGNGVIA
jgi:hypothetical protein